MKKQFYQSIKNLALEVQNIAIQAVLQYSHEVDRIIQSQENDARRIERTLDGMLDFCFDDEMLLQYKKLCRYYYAIDPGATAEYVYAYRDMWDDLPNKKKIGHSHRKRAKRAANPPTAKVMP